MTTSTDAILCFGIPQDDDKEYPWENNHMDFEEWWLKVNGYKPLFITKHLKKKRKYISS